MPTEILQISDLHLMTDPKAELKGLCTRDLFISVIEYIRQQEQVGRWNFDRIIITGDLAHDEQLETYQALRELLGDWVPRCRLIPGNHDNRDFIRQTFPELVSSEGRFLSFSTESSHWRLIGLDSHVPGETYGRLEQDQLAWLADELRAKSGQPVLLFMHHPPISVQSSWLDGISLEDAADLLETVHASPDVKLICTGHVHQEFSDSSENVKILTTPSTGVQFLPNTDDLVVEKISPGFRIIRLHENSFETEVVRLP